MTRTLFSVGGRGWRAASAAAAERPESARPAESEPGCRRRIAGKRWLLEKKIMPTVANAMKVLQACIEMFNIVMRFHFLKPFIEFATGGTWQERISLVRQLLLVQYRVRLAVPGLIGL